MPAYELFGEEVYQDNQHDAFRRGRPREPEHIQVGIND